MKLRIRGNSIRLRLTRSEVEEFQNTGKIEDRIVFGPSSELAYEFAISFDGRDTQAGSSADRISISIPENEALEWFGSDRTTIESMQPIGDSQFLRILVEKDFACLSERPGEDDSDAFVNPSATAEC